MPATPRQFTSPPAWLDHAPCRAQPTKVFYPTSAGPISQWSRITPETIERIEAPAKAICRACPHQTACLDWAIDTDERFGIWGGLNPRERIIEARRRARNQGVA